MLLDYPHSSQKENTSITVEEHPYERAPLVSRFCCHAVVAILLTGGCSNSDSSSVERYDTVSNQCLIAPPMRVYYGCHGAAVLL